MEKYEKYRDSGIEWIGEIPEHWEVGRIKYFLEYQKGKNPDILKTTQTENSQVYLAMDYLRNNPKQIFFVEEPEKYIQVNDSDILLLWDGSNAGEFVIAKNGVLSSTMAVLKLKNIEEKYSWYYFKYFERKLQESTIGMGVPHVNSEELKNGIFVIPTPEEQTTIANYLDRKTAQIDQLIADKKRLLELYEEEKTAIINQAVTKGINHDVKMKESGIEWLGEIPEHWEVKKLKYVTESLNHIRIPLSSSERGIMMNKTYDYYGASGVIDKVEDYLFDEPLILIGEDGANLLTRTKRLVFIAKGKYWVNNHAHILRVTYGLLEYYCELLELYDFKIWVSGSAQPKLTSENLMNINIIVPPLSEQTAIVQYIETEINQINAKSEKTKKLIDLLTEYRTALISEVVTGKIKVTK